MPAVYPPNGLSPWGVCNVDPTNGLAYSVGLAQYAAVSTAGTTTIKGGNNGGVYYGINAISVGTTWTLTPYDIIVSGTTTTTNQLHAITTAASVGFQSNPGPGGTGVNFRGSFIVVTSGTPGLWNVLWD